MGGPERTFTLTRRQLAAHTEEAYWEGFDCGHERAVDELRDEIRAELADEIEAFDPNCPMCLVVRELTDVRQELVVVRSDYDMLLSSRRGRTMREGRYPYRETR